MNVLSTAERAQIVRCLVDGTSIRATCRITGFSKNTVSKLLVELGTACADYQDKALRNLPCLHLQADEVWCFVGAKEANVKPEKKAKGWGDAWTWTVICADCKLIPSWLIGPRDSVSATTLMGDAAGRLANHVQLTTDGLRSYLVGVEAAFGADIDFAQLIKLYGEPEGVSSERKYSPGECCGTRKYGVCGKPDPKHVSTSFSERSNLTMRMNMRRFTRLTNAFSKKLANLRHACALHFMYYNFARIHQTLRVTPAMEAGIAEHAWTVEEIVALLDEPRRRAA